LAVLHLIILGVLDPITRCHDYGAN